MNYSIYPKYKRHELQKKYASLPSNERQIIDNFIRYVSITSASKLRHENNKRNLTAFRDITGKSLDRVSLNDLRGFLGLLNQSHITRSSQNDVKASIKRFLRWYYKDWSERFNELRDIRLKFGINEAKINHNTLPTKEEIEKILDAEKRLLWKSFFLTLYESGLRPKELRTLTWDKIRFNTDGEMSEISVYATKTSKARTIYIKEATRFLKRLRETRINTKNPLVFPSPKDPHKPITKDLLAHWLRRISMRVINKPITPYMLRHKRANELYVNSGMDSSIVQKIMGHSQDMKQVYVHLSPDDVKEAMAKIVYKLRDEEELPEKKKHELESKIESLKEEHLAFKREMLKIMKSIGKD